VLRGQPNQLITSADEKRVGAYDQAPGLLSDQRREGGIDIFICAGSKDVEV
jgi:hypothetical protein